MSVFKNVNKFVSIDCLSAKLLSYEAGMGHAGKNTSKDSHSAFKSERVTKEERHLERTQRITGLPVQVPAGRGPLTDVFEAGRTSGGAPRSPLGLRTLVKNSG
jgi:hypothetical protein